MDFEKLLKQNMKQDDLFQFSKKSVEKEREIQDYVNHRDQYMEMSAEQLRNLYQKDTAESGETLADLPKQEEAKKEWKFFKGLNKKKKAKARREQSVLSSLQDRMQQGFEAMAQKEADDLLLYRKESRQDNLKKFRTDMQEKTDYSFIKSQHLNNEDQYKQIVAVKKLLEENQLKYEEHKTELDKMYEEYFHLTEASADLQERINFITVVPFTSQNVSSTLVLQELEKRLNDAREKQKLIQSRADSVKAGIEYLLTEKELTTAQSLAVREYLSPQDQLEKQWKQSEQQAALQKNKLQEKADAFKTLRENAGENSGQVIKEQVVAYLEQIKEFDTRDLEHAGDEQLLAQNEQLQELYAMGAVLANAVNHKDPQDKQERSIKDVFLEKNKIGKGLFDLKCSVLQSLAEKARCLTMIQAYKNGVLSKDAFLDKELKAIHRQYHLMQDQELSQNQLLSFVKERLALAEGARYGAYNRFLKSREAEALVKKEPLETVHHKTYLQERDDLRQEVKDALNLKESPDAEHMAKYYVTYRRKVEVIEKSLVNAKEEEKTWLKEELKKATRKMEMVQIEFALTMNHYRKVDDGDPSLNEPFFRSYGAVEGLSAFRTMNDEEFRTMLVKLSAGALAPDAATPKEFDEYYAENKEGLETYKEHMRMHYEDLEERFHHQIPSFAYILEHRQELGQLLANVQVDTEFVEKMREVIDLTKEEDQYLYHLVHFYGKLGTYIEFILHTAILDVRDLKKAEAGHKDLVQAMKPHTDYLGEEQSKQEEKIQQEEQSEQEEKIEQEEEGQQKEESKQGAQEEQDVTRFRQLALNAEHIVEAEREEQLLFLEKTLELRNYIKQYQGNSPLVLKQLKGWYEFARKRALFMAQKPGSSIYVLLEKISALHVEEKMLEPEYIKANIEKLQAAFRDMDTYQEILRETPAFKELLLSDAQRIEWSIQRGLMERYRAYVAQVVEGQQIQQGEQARIQPQETEKEKERLQHLAREKEGMQEVLGGFGGYAQKMDALVKQVGTIKQLKKKDRMQTREETLKALREAGLWINDLSRYVKRPLVLSTEDLFDASVMTMMSMLGYVEQNLRMAEEKLSEIDPSEQVQGIKGQMEQISEAFLMFKERVPGYAQEIRKDILSSGENISLTLQDVVMGVQGIKVFQVNGQTERTGAGASDVLILKDEDGTFFFKENETLPDFKAQIEEMLSMLDDEELIEKFQKLLDQELPESSPESVMMSGNLDTLKRTLEKNGGLIDEEHIRLFSQLDKQLEELARVINRYAGEGDEKRNKWAKFVNKFTKAHVTQEAASNQVLNVQIGADMTARNYAAERVAELFGLKGLIVRNREAAVVDENGNRKQGFVMDKAKGKQAAEVATFAVEKGYQMLFTEEAQKNLLNLQILDNIVGQIDRHMGNYFLDYVQDDEKKTITIHQVTGIDNDFAFGLSELLGGHNTGSVFDWDKKKNTGKYYPGMIDIKMYESLMAISPELLVVNLEGVIEKKYLEALKKRYESARKAIREAKLEADQNGIDFFRTKSGWGQETQTQLARKKDNVPSEGNTLYIHKLLR